uniref:Integrase catalytic domain-containing protein n=1 Tax=Paramormyrops kingsleyae TaxID=1676925 RepID=A0A3B3TBN9_9TELE
MELVCIDFWSAEDSRNRSVDVLVITDHFTRLAQAFPCRDQSAKQVARVLWDRYFCVYGFPERVHSDQGASFESQLICELLRVSGVRKSHTTPYHPMGNGSVERFNKTLGSMVRTLAPTAKGDWPRQLQTLTFVYNCTAHETTGYAPFYLMFGRIPRLPVDVMFRSVLNDPAVGDYDKYVAALTTDLKGAMVIAQEHAVKEQRRHAVHYNRRVRGPTIAVNDPVLLANKAERGKRKVADRWESTIYTIVDRNPNTHTYRIRNSVTGQEKVVHRNLLMLANFLPVAERDSPLSLSSSLSSFGADGLVEQMDADEVLSRVGVAPVISDQSPQEGAVQDERDGFLVGQGSAQDSMCGDVNMASESIDLLSLRPQADTEQRTVEWVSQLSDGCSLPAVDSVSPCHSLGSTLDMDSGTGAGAQSVWPDSVTAIETTSVTPVLSCGGSGKGRELNDSPSCDHVFPPEVCTGPTSAPVRVRTRLGRVIKPVSRLLYTMSGQDVVTDVKSNVRGVYESLVKVFHA